MDLAIEAHQLTKTYNVPVKDPGIAGALRGLVRPQKRAIHAVRGLELSITPGARVALMGRNGAGKTTTLKMLCGLVRPTSGSLQVLGYAPHERRGQFLRGISFIRGSKPLEAPGILTLHDILRHQAVLYGVERGEFGRRLEFFSTTFNLGEDTAAPDTST